MAFERIDSEVVYEGKIATVYVDTVRYDDDGEEADARVRGASRARWRWWPTTASGSTS